MIADGQTKNATGKPRKPMPASLGLHHDHEPYGFTMFRRFDAIVAQLQGFPVFIMFGRLMVYDPDTMRPYALPAMWPGWMYRFEATLRGM